MRFPASCALPAIAFALFSSCVTAPPPKPAAKPSLGKHAALPTAKNVRPAAKPAPIVAKVIPTVTLAVPPVPVPEPEPRFPPGAPLYLSARPSLNDFRFLADGGETYGFSVGYGRSWVARLPPVPAGPWARAFVGAKLGAMKTERKPGRPDWDRRVVPGEIIAAVSPEPSWPQSRRYSLTRTEAIPLASDPKQPLDGVGEARWFWVEVPLPALSSATPNFVALFSPDETLKGEDRSPVLAGARSGGSVQAWWRDKAEGEPPRTSTETFQFPAVSYTPAVALKLVPARSTGPVVKLRLPADRSTVGNSLVVWAAVEGADVEAVWLESSTDGKTWSRLGRPVFGAPYFFSEPRDSLPRGSLSVRVAARDIWETVGTSPAVQVKTGRH